MAIANQRPSDVASDYAALMFAVQQKLSEVQTLTLVRVIECSNDGGITPVGTLTVQPLVNLMTADRVGVKHKPLYHLPYVRMQGGTSAFILDPKPGDIGLAGFCDRDISVVKETKDIANPGSYRMFAKADGIWIGGCLNGVPTQYVVLNDDGIGIVSPTAVTIQAPTINLQGNVVQTGGDVTMSQDLTVEGTVWGKVDCISDTISGKNHLTSGVTPGPGTSGPPQ